MQIGKDTAAIVTGGASGLGEATARRLASHGVKVAIFDMNAERGDKVAAEIGGICCQVDVSNEASVDAGLAKARGLQGIERILVNCAGIGPPKKTISRDKATAPRGLTDRRRRRAPATSRLIGRGLDRGAYQ